MKTPLCGMLTLAAIYFTAQTTTPPTGKVGINTTEPTETLDVKGKVRIQELYSENDQTGTNNNATFTATNVVTADDSGVLGKKSLSSIIATQTPNFPWKKVGTTDENAVPNYGLKMYSKYAVGIGDYSAASSSIDSSFEINGGDTKQLGLINTKNGVTTMWHISTENKALTFTKRKPENGRVFSLTTDANVYLGNNIGEDGSSAKIILNGKDGKIGVGKNSADYKLDVAGDAKISGLKTTNDNITNGSTTKKYAPTKMVVTDDNGILGKQDLPTIPTIPTEPWQVAGSTTQATANNQKIYQNNNVGIGDYSSTDIVSRFEINGGNSSQLGLINGNTKWDISTEDKSLTFTKRKPENGRIFSVTQEAKLYLANGLSSDSGGGAKITLDGKDGKIGINKNSADYNLDVAGDAKISGLKDGTGYTATHMVVADANGVLGKASIPSIPAIPTEPWRQLGGTTQATANTDNIYQNGKVGIGNYTSTSTFDSDFEVNSNRNGYHVGIANGADTKWNLSAESGDERAFTITKRHKDGAGRLLSITKEAKLFLGNTLTTAGGGNTKITLDGKDGNIILIDKWRVGLKGNSLMFYNSSTTGDSNNKFTLTNEGKLFLGKDMNGDGNGTSANILLDGKDGKVAIGKNSASYTLDVNGNTGIKGQLNLIDADSDNNDFLLYSKGTQLLFDKKITVPAVSATQTGVTAALTNVGKLYLGNGLTSSNNIYSGNAKILLDGQDGKVAIGHNNPAEALDVKGKAKIQTIDKQTATTGLDMVVVGADGILKKAAIPTSGGNGVTKHTGTSAPQCNAANAGTIHYKEDVNVNGQSTSVMGFCMKTADSKYRWFYIFGGAGTTTGSADTAPTFGTGL